MYPFFHWEAFPIPWLDVLLFTHLDGDQVSDKIGQTEAGHIICIMGGADHIMRFVEDLCCLILAGLLDTFIE